jgi:hypothetical protein
MRHFVVGSTGAALLLLCGCQKTDAVADANKAMNVITGDDQQPASANSTCRMFSSTEAASYIGEPVGAPENAAMGSGCAWPAKDGDGEVVIAIVPAADHEPPTGGEGFQKLASPGTEGFAIPQLGGWVAGSIVGDKAIRVTVMGQTASEATAAKLLTDVAARIPAG